LMQSESFFLLPSCVEGEMVVRSGSTKVDIREVGFSVSWGCSIDKN
jgi:hypothetical protein